MNMTKFMFLMINELQNSCDIGKKTLLQNFTIT